MASPHATGLRSTPPCRSGKCLFGPKRAIATLVARLKRRTWSVRHSAAWPRPPPPGLEDMRPCVGALRLCSEELVAGVRDLLTSILFCICVLCVTGATEVCGHLARPFCTIGTVRVDCVFSSHTAACGNRISAVVVVMLLAIMLFLILNSNIFWSWHVEGSISFCVFVRTARMIIRSRHVDLFQTHGTFFHRHLFSLVYSMLSEVYIFLGTGMRTFIYTAGLLCGLCSVLDT